MLCFFDANCRKWKINQVFWCKQVGKAESLRGGALRQVTCVMSAVQTHLVKGENVGQANLPLSVRALPASQKLQTVTSWMFSQEGINSNSMNQTSTPSEELLNLSPQPPPHSLKMIQMPQRCLVMAEI